MTELINTIPFVLLAGGVAWYLYEQDKKIDEIKRHVTCILNVVVSMEINQILEASRSARDAGDEKAAAEFMKRVKERIAFLVNLNGRDVAEFVKCGDNAEEEES